MGDYAEEVEEEVKIHRRDVEGRLGDLMVDSDDATPSQDEMDVKAIEKKEMEFSSEGKKEEVEGKAEEEKEDDIEDPANAKEEDKEDKEDKEAKEARFGMWDEDIAVMKDTDMYI